MSRLSRAWCRVWGHAWYAPEPGVLVCARLACRGHADAVIFEVEPWE